MTSASAGFERCEPDAAGMSRERLDRLDARLDQGVASGEIPGAVLLVLRDGRLVHERVVGSRDPSAGVPMRGNTIFRLASMSKPITAVAAMILVEDGAVRLSDPIASHLPELAGLQVGVERDDPETGVRVLGLEAPRRAPTVQDLFRHTSGLSNGWGPRDASASLIAEAYRRADVYDRRTQTAAEQIARFAALPLASHPGTTFEYGPAYEVLGRIVEVASGERLERFVKRRIAEPLGLETFDFHAVDPARFALPLPADLAPEQVDPLSPPIRGSGSGGLFTTARDYARFAQMLANGGVLDGVRVLARKTVALMASDHLEPGTRFATSNPDMGIIAPTLAMGQGFGLGFAVRTSAGRNPAPGSVGEFYWAGAAGSYFWIDPVERLVVVYMAAAPRPAVKNGYREMLRHLVYAALER